MYWIDEPSNVVRKTSVRGAARSGATAGSRGHRPTSDQCADWMNESARRGRWSSPPDTAATIQVNRTHTAHHSVPGSAPSAASGPCAGDATTRCVVAAQGALGRFLGCGGTSGERLGRHHLEPRAAAPRAGPRARGVDGGIRRGAVRTGRSRAAHGRARDRQDPARAARSATRRAPRARPSRWRAAGTAAALPPTGRGSRSSARSPPSAPTSACAADLGAGARWVAQIAPELRDRVGLPEAGEASAESEQARFALFDAVAIFLRRVAADAPVSCSSTTSTRPICPRCSCSRSSRGAIGDAARARRLDPSRRGAEAAVSRSRASSASSAASAAASCSPASTTPTCAGSSPTAAAPTRPTTSSRSSRAVTEGNPFFSDEVVRLLVAHGGGRARRPPAAARRRPRRDPPPPAAARAPRAARPLEVAAVAGRGFRVATLERAAGVPRAELLERLDEALALHLLAEAPEPGRSFRFAHGLIRDTLYNDLSAVRRARLHGADRRGARARGHRPRRRRAARARPPLHRGRPGGRRPARARLRRARGPRGAAGARLRAGRRPVRRGAPRPRPHPRARREAPRRLVLARGQAQMHAGEDAARDCLLEAVALAKQLGDTTSSAAPRCPRRLRALPRHRRQRARQRARGGARGVDPADRALRGRCSSGSRSRSTGATSPTAATRSSTRPSRSPAGSATPRRSPSSSTRAGSRPPGPTRSSASSPGRTSCSRCPSSSATTRRRSGRGWHIDLLLELDDLPAADMAIATLDRIATDVRDPRARSYIPLHRARRALMEGRAEEAERLIDEGVKLAWSLHDSTVPILAGAQLFSLRRAQGRLGELETAVHQFADSLRGRRGAAPWPSSTSTTPRARGAARARAPRRPRLADFPRDNVWMVSMALLAELCEGLHDGEHAAEVEKLLTPFAARNVVSPEGIFGGPVTRYLALCAAARDDWNAARATWRPRQRRPSGCPRPDARAARPRRGAVLARRDGAGDAEAARRLLERARERSGSLGVPVIGDKLAARRANARRAAGAGRGAGGSPLEAPATPAAALCREGDVWRVDTRAARATSRTPRACATSRCSSTTPASSSTPSTSSARPRAHGRARGARERGGRRRRRGAPGRRRRRRRAARPAGQARVPQAPQGPARGDRGGRVASTIPSAPRAPARRWSSSPVSCRARSASAGATAGRLERRARPRERDARREDVIRRIAAEDESARTRARDDRPHRLLLPLRARPAASGRLAGRWRLSRRSSLRRDRRRLGLRGIGHGVPAGRARPQRAAPRARPAVPAGLLPAHAARDPRRRVLGPARRAHGLCELWSLHRHRRGRLERPRRRLADLRERRAAQGRRRRSSSDEHERWPLSCADLEPHYDAVEAMQGAAPYPADREPYASTPKTNALLAAAEQAGARRVPPERRGQLRAGRLAAGDAARARAPTSTAPPRYTCRLCGECIVGCQYGSKNTLDFTYLERGAGGRRDDPLLLRGDADRPARRRRLDAALPPAPGREGGPPARPARPDRRARAHRRARRSSSSRAERSAARGSCSPTGRACRA